MDPSFFFNQSIIATIINWLNTSRIPIPENILNWFNDGVNRLDVNPEGMYIYNLRALFMASGFLFLVILSLFSLSIVNFPEVIKTLSLLWTVLILSASITFIYHRNFLQKLREEERKGFSNLHLLFRPYFLLDASILGLATFIGEYLLDVRVMALLFLVISNLFIYSLFMGGAYVGKNARFKLINSLILPSLIITFIVGWYGFHVSLTENTLSPEWLYTPILISCLLGSVLIVIISNVVISSIRQGELITSTKIINQLTSTFDLLSQQTSDEILNEFKDNDLLKQLIKSVCTDKQVFNYQAAKLWKYEEDSFVEYVSYPSAQTYIFFNEEITSKDIISISNLFSSNRIHETICIELSSDNLLNGVIELHRSNSGPLSILEKHFLVAFARIINIVEQWAQAKEELVALHEIDNLLDQNDLSEVFKAVLTILQNHLPSKGVMLLLINRNTGKMVIEDSQGLDKKILNQNKYALNRGMTGECGRTGKSIRLNEIGKDDKLKNLFDVEMLANLELALKAPIDSWMSIPIGKKEKVVGIIKVINKHSKGSRFFTDHDEKLVRSIALKLGLLIERATQLTEVLEAQQKATNRAEVAKKAEQEAQKAAEDREEALVSLAHQLQGPIWGSYGRISLVLEEQTLSKWLRNHLKFSTLLLDDSTDMIYGVLLTAGMEAGQDHIMDNEEVVVSQEAISLVERVKQTKNRPDLRFKPIVHPDFPQIILERRLFRSVAYSLVHNAMKYADRNSYVEMECGFEWHPNSLIQTFPAVKFKTIGPPIRKFEQDLIFEKFYRSKSVLDGRFGNGIGLGLWVARELMRSIGGDILLETSNSNPDLSVFVIYFGGLNNNGSNQ